MDRLPGAVQMMAKAAQDAGLTVNGTASELEDLMKKGKVMSADVLPFFAKRLQEFASANGALTSKLDSNRVAMNRLKSSYEISANEFFEGGYGGGLTDVFNTLANTLSDLNPMFRVLSKIVGAFFKAFAFGLSLITAPLNFFFTQIEKLTDVFGDWIVTIPVGLGLIALSLNRLTKAAAVFGIALNASFLPVMLTLAAVVGMLVLVEDFFRSFDPNYDTVLNRVRDTLGSFQNTGFTWGNQSMAVPTKGTQFAPAPSISIGQQQININGAQDPKRVAEEVAARMAMAQQR